MKDMNRCIMYLQVLYLSDVTDIAGHHIEAWVIKGKQDDTRKGMWEWSIHQQPSTAAWKVWNKSTHQLGEWYDEGRHGQIEYHLDAREIMVYRCKNEKWVRHDAKQ
jgi:hypothetical protein